MLTAWVKNLSDEHRKYIYRYQYRLYWSWSCSYRLPVSLHCQQNLRPKTRQKIIFSPLRATELISICLVKVPPTKLIKLQSLKSVVGFIFFRPPDHTNAIVLAVFTPQILRKRKRLNKQSAALRKILWGLRSEENSRYEFSPNLKRNYLHRVILKTKWLLPWTHYKARVLLISVSI